MKKKKETVTKLMKELDAIFSRYIRLSHAKLNSQGELVVSCYTCGHTNHPKKMQAGHFISRFYKIVRWHEDNVRPQCVMCNMFKNGDTVNFRMKLVEEIGEEKVQDLEEMHKTLIKLDMKDLKEKISYYKKELEKYADM